MLSTDADDSFAPPWRRFASGLFDSRATYRLTRVVILRLLALVFVVAFAVAYEQLVPLVGARGLLPADAYLRAIAAHEGGRSAGFWAAPSVFWLTGTSDLALRTVSLTGLVLALAALFGATNAALQFVIWALYLSVTHIGQTFYGYGWEAQLCETGLLAVFLCPMTTIRPLRARDPPTVVIWLFRWLIVRVMLGAGLIKLRGDPCWRDLTCLVYHYETQPVPSPVSWLLHQAPSWFQALGVLFNHLVELVVPFFVFSPRRFRHVAGALLVLFQVTLIVSGNLSFLNWLTIVPALACFDDRALARMFPRKCLKIGRSKSSRAHLYLARGLAFVVSVLSVNVVANLLSSSQVMNTSYDRFEVVGTYGAFGSINRERYEVVLEGTSDEAITESTEWREYALPCKPGDVRRRPCVITPYHYRLDWQMWFAGFQTYEDEPWIVHLVLMLLRGDSAPKSLFATDPFPSAPPRFVRAELFRYEMTRVGDGSGAWWKRTLVGEYLRPMSKDDPDLLDFARANGWK